MGDVSVVHADQQAEAKPTNTSQGTLKTAGGEEHQIYPFADTESVSQGVQEFLADANTPEMPKMPLGERSFTHINQETIEVETQIAELSEELENHEAPKTKQELKPLPRNLAGETKKPVYSSLFSLARSFNSSLNEKRAQSNPKQPQQERSEIRQQTSLSAKSETFKNELQMGDSRYDQQERDEEQKEGGGQQQQGQQQDQQQQQKRKEQFNVKASTSTSSRPRTSNPQASQPQQNTSLGGLDSIFIRFMALMARILGQAEAEAHALYLRIKDRTDAIDHLTLLISKLNNEKGDIDWSKNEEMKQIVDRARELGVDIPEGKYKWTDDEKKLLKENIQMRKDSMEKVTQLERTDMQRFLQEASQCHQARSNVLKLLKEVMDTIIHNMRP